ncbi:hypothetical protein ES703_20296 [subsurface metagenome]
MCEYYRARQKFVKSKSSYSVCFFLTSQISETNLVGLYLEDNKAGIHECQGVRARGDGYQGYADLMEGSDLTALPAMTPPP